MAQIANLKFVAEICMWVRIPPPVPASPSRPVPLIEERGDFFRTRFVGSMASCRRQIMICGSLLSSCLPDCPIAICGSLLSQSPRLPYRSPYRCLGEFYSIRRTALLFGLAGSDFIALPSCISFPMGGENSTLAHLLAPLSAQSASRIPPRLAFRRAARCLRSSVQMSGEYAYFSRVYPFLTSIPLLHVIH